MNAKVLVAIALLGCVLSLVDGVNDGKYRRPQRNPNNPGLYRPNGNNGKYTPDNSGKYTRNSGKYVPNQSGAGTNNGKYRRDGSGAGFYVQDVSGTYGSQYNLNGKYLRSKEGRYQEDPKRWRYVHVDDMRELGKYIHIHIPYNGGYGPYTHIPNPYKHFEPAYAESNPIGAYSCVRMDDQRHFDQFSQVLAANESGPYVDQLQGSDSITNSTSAPELILIRKDDNGYKPFKDNYGYTPFKDQHGYTPFKDQHGYTPFKDQHGYTPFKDKYPYTPFKDQYPYDPYKDKYNHKDKDQYPLDSYKDKYDYKQDGGHPNNDFKDKYNYKDQGNYNPYKDQDKQASDPFGQTFFNDKRPEILLEYGFPNHKPLSGRDIQQEGSLRVDITTPDEIDRKVARSILNYDVRAVAESEKVESTDVSSKPVQENVKELEPPAKGSSEQQSLPPAVEAAKESTKSESQGEAVSTTTTASTKSV